MDNNNCFEKYKDNLSAYRHADSYYRVKRKGHHKNVKP